MLDTRYFKVKDKGMPLREVEVKIVLNLLVY